MTPSEVIIMRDKLAGQFENIFGYGSASSQELADWLIEFRWVTGNPDAD